jgi:hypothetical protein
MQGALDDAAMLSPGVGVNPMEAVAFPASVSPAPAPASVAPAGGDGSGSTFPAYISEESSSDESDIGDSPWLMVRCAFFDGGLHSRMPLVPTPARLKLLYACVQWHSSRVSTFLPVHTLNNGVQILKAALEEAVR